MVKSVIKLEAMNNQNAQLITNMASKEKAYWIKSGSYSLLERVIGQILGFGNMFLLLRAVSEHEYGLGFNS